MQITYTCSESDFVRATALLLRKRNRRLLIISGMCCFVLLYMIFELLTSAAMRSFLLDLDHLPRTLAGTVLPLFISLTPLLALQASRKTYRRTPAVAETRTIDFNDFGYSARSASASGEVRWSVYDTFYEDKSSFLLMQKGSQIFVPIPKRQLTPAQIDELHSILETHLPRR